MIKTRIFPLFIITILAVFLLACTSLSSGSKETIEAKKPFPQHTVYMEGVIKPNDRSQEQLDSDVADYYAEWKEHYLYTVPDTEPSQKFIHYNLEKAEWVEPENAVTVSEAHGYGMVILAAMAGYDSKAKEDFDAMYYFWKAHPSIFSPYLMCWQEVQNDDGSVADTPEGPDSATDGDLDIAYALLMADNQWGSDGNIDYRSEALKCLEAIMEKEVDENDWILLMGDWVKSGTDVEVEYLTGTRSSDFMLDHLRAFAQADKNNKDKWLNVLGKTQDIINSIYENWSPETGLMPDFINKDEEGVFSPVEGEYLEDVVDGDYNYNAARDPWRLSLDYIVNGDTTIKPCLDTLNSFIKETTGLDPEAVSPGYYVSSGKNGDPLPDRDYQDLSFTAPFAVSAMIDVSNQEWLNNLWIYLTAEDDEELFGFPQDYFGDTIRMQVMLIVSGNWWVPN